VVRFRLALQGGRGGAHDLFAPVIRTVYLLFDIIKNLK
jgi:hypothetical protein